MKAPNMVLNHHYVRFKVRRFASRFLSFARNLGFSSDPPRANFEEPVLLLGGGQETADLIVTLRQFSLTVVAVHEPFSAGGTGPHSLRMSRHKFFRFAERTKYRVVVGYYTVKGDKDSFLETVRYAREVGRYQGRLTHLAALNDLHRYKPTRYLFAGFASSGNMIFQNILLEIIQRTSKNETPLSDPISGKLASYAINHTHSLLRCFERYFSLDLMTAVGSPTHIKFGQVLFQSNDRYLAVSGVAMRPYAWSPEWFSNHEPITAEALGFYESQGYQIIAIVRHPLDVIVSNAAKMSSVLDGPKRPEIALSNPRWFESILDRVMKYMASLSQHKDKVHILYYENLLADPVSEIRKLTTLIRRPIPDEELRSIFRKFENVPVAGAKHFWQPGAGKWTRYLGEEHLRIVRNTNLIEVASCFGYAIREADFNGRPLDRINHLRLPDGEKIAWMDAILHIPIGTDFCFDGDLVALGKPNAEIECFVSRADEESARVFLQSMEFTELVESGDWRESSIFDRTVHEVLCGRHVSGRASFSGAF